jgi:hypothetical protein
MSRSKPTTISRRSLMAAVPVAAASLTPAAAAALSGFAPPVAGVDPILAVIAAHKAAVEEDQSALAIHMNKADETPEWWATKPRADAADAELMRCVTALFSTAPTSPFGLARLLVYLHQPEWPDEPGKSERETGISIDRLKELEIIESKTILIGSLDWNGAPGRAAEGWPSFIARVLDGWDGVHERRISNVEPAAADPIFAAIERHRAAWAEFSARCSELDDEGTEEARAEWDRLAHAADVALGEVYKPETIGGAVAAMRYVASLIPGAVIVESRFPRLLLVLADALATIERRAQS